MKRILVDMDGVLADVYARFFELYKEGTGLTKTTDEIMGLKEAEAFPEAIRWVETTGFFRSLPVIPDILQASLTNNYGSMIISRL